MKSNTPLLYLLSFSFIALSIIACQQDPPEPTPPVELTFIRVDTANAAQVAEEIRQSVTVELAEGIALSLWASDSLAPDPIALHMDEQGRAYITRTNRQKNSEFDIRGHRDWITDAISLQSVEDRRAFLRKTFATELSEENDWLEDLNKDSIHDWRDLAVEKDQVFCLEDKNGDGYAEVAQEFIKDFHEEVTDVAGALVKYEGDIFLGIAPDLWRLSDENGDGQADKKTSISHGYQVHIGFSGHGMSGLTVGPDGKLYWGIGDIGMNVVDQTGKQWKYPNQGVIVRANPDGSDFEVYAAGLRNTHEFVFDEYGNLFSEDNDGDHPGESERLVYIVNGSDSGWRTNWQFGKYTDSKNNTYKVWMEEKLYVPRFEGQAAYIIPPIRNYHNGPTGMVYNPGTALSDRWKNHFFVAEFVGSPSRSNIWAFRLQPKGAGFDFLDEEKFLGGLLTTGLSFGPDGALYAADWIDGWGTKDFGRIWKLDDPTAVNAPIRQETKGYLVEDFSKRPASDLGNLLKHPDQRVRQKAQFALAKLGKEGAEIFQQNILQKEHQLARIHGIWGLCQLARKDVQYAEILPTLLNDADPEIRAQTAKLLGDIRYQPVGASLVPLLKDESLRVQFFAAEAIGRIAYEPAIQPLIDMLIANDDKDLYLRHAGALALARIGKPGTVAELANHPSKALRLAAVVALRRMKSPSIKNFLQDEEEFIVTEVARAINDDFSIEEALPDLAKILTDERFREEALIRRAINANLRVGEQENIQILVDFINRKSASSDMRAEALATLGTWAEPSVLDRVDGRLRGSIKRNPAPVQQAIAAIIDPLLSDPTIEIRIAAAGAAGRLQLQQTAPKLFTLFQTSRQADLRVSTLQALFYLQDERLNEVMEMALKDKNRQVRVSALEIIPDLNLSSEKMLDLFSITLETGSIPEQQAAINGLSKVAGQTAHDILDKLIDQLIAGKLPNGIRLELIEAIEKSKSSALQEKLDIYNNSKPKDDQLAQYIEALEGGNARNGRRIFRSHEAAQCTRCHKIGAGDGSDVGPNLQGIANRLSNETLLQSLVDPSARIAPGYGVVTLTLKDGETVVGFLMEETDSHVLVKIKEDEIQKIAISEIQKREDTPSSMPAMGNLLDKGEIRDLVAYLSIMK